MINKNQKRRDQICIIADILNIAKQGALKTQIMYKANLSFTQLNNYLTYLIEYNLITETTNEGKETYIITKKGLDYLRKQKELLKIIETKNDIIPNRQFSQTLIYKKIN